MPRRVGRPGLIGTMARTAVIAGTATAVSGSVANKQSQKYAAQQEAQQQPQYAQPAPAAPAYAAPEPAAAAAAPEAGGISDDALDRLQKLSALHSAGALTDEEFAAAKAKILGL